MGRLDMKRTEYKGMFKKHNVPLEEFPGLFVMEGHTGFFGAAFTGMWIAAATLSHISLRTPLPLEAGAIVVAMFFTLSVCATQISSNYTKAVLKLVLTPDPELRWILGVYARRWVAIFSFLFGVICCGLIYLTGGVLSPFVPFYIMTFTLTISRNKVPWFSVLVFIFFAVVILAACGAYDYWQWPISKVDMANMEHDGFQRFLYYLFIGLSLAVPTISAFGVARKEAKDQAAADKAVADKAAADQAAAAPAGEAAKSV